MKSRHNRSLRAALAAVLAGVLLLCAACGAEASIPAIPDEEPLPEQTLSPEPERAVPVVPEQTEEEAPPPEEAPAPFTFGDVAGLEFYFSSGAGGWRTVLYINADGSFCGLYTDSDMGDLDETAYPNGTRYICSFSGAFTEPEQVNDYTWRTQVKELTCADPLGEKLEGGFRYVYTEAYGICGAEDVYLYRPGAPLAELPEAYRGWVGYYDLTQTEETELPFYGLYNEAEQNGFSSYALPSAAGVVQRELEWAESTAAELEAELQNAITQLDMNVISSDLYQVWDTALNTLWQQLKRELDADAMAQLTAEQLTWIRDKEAAAAAAGAAYEGGSMQGMVINLEAAELTKQRVYVLVEYLK